MAFQRSNVNWQFQAPNLDPNLVRPDNKIGSSLESLFNNYMQMQQNKRAGASADLQAQVAQQQLAAGQRQAASADIQETAQFGAPLASFSAEDRSRASAGITQGPGDQAGQDRLRKFAEGLHAIGEKSRMASKGVQLDQDKTQAEIDALNRKDVPVVPAPGAPTSGPQTITKDGREYQVITDAKGGVRYSPMQPLEKPIAAEAVKTGSLAEAGLRAIGQIRGIIKDPNNRTRMFSPSTVAGGFGGDFIAAATGDTQSQIMSQQIAEAGDALARLRTGAAISVVEEARYGGLLKGRYKTAEAYENALSTVDAFLNQVNNDIKTGRRKEGGAQGGGGKIRVTNGKETFTIDAADEADAAKDGYARAQ